jgi:hypothetical protein
MGMGYWVISLMVIDLVFMAGVLYFLSTRSAGEASMPDSAAAVAAADPGAYPLNLIEELKSELEAVKRSSAEFEKKQQSLESYEKTIRDRRRSLDRMINEADKSIDDIRSSGPADSPQRTDDIYKRAMDMLGRGTSVDRVMNTLGIVEGEAELISALSSYRA